MGQNLFHTFLFVFGLLERNSNKPKATDCGQNFVPFPNTSSEMLCLFLFKSSERFFEKPEQIILNGKATVFVYSISSFSSTLRIVRVGRFVERILLYNKWYSTKLWLLLKQRHKHFIKRSVQLKMVFGQKDDFSNNEYLGKMKINIPY